MTATVSSAATPAQIAKGALRRLAMQQLEPTPEHFAKAYAQEAGQPASEDPGRAWASLIERLARGLERGGRHWTGARKKQSLQRVLDGSRSDAVRLQQRLGQLMNAWDDDKPAGDVEPSGLAPLDEAGANGAATATAREPEHAASRHEGGDAAHAGADWRPLLQEVRATLSVALPRERGDAAAVADALATAAQRLADEGPHAALVGEIAGLCEQARAHLSHRH
ncbi:MAG TPA: GGDEF domain-containing protein, partial [Burkholderiaceae bacterium]|nr:GGDEF domain-containing protein [Burkholderiaceae bacterium]